MFVCVRCVETPQASYEGSEHMVLLSSARPLTRGPLSQTHTRSIPPCYRCSSSLSPPRPSSAPYCLFLVTALELLCSWTRCPSPGRISGERGMHPPWVSSSWLLQKHVHKRPSEPNYKWQTQTCAQPQATFTLLVICRGSQTMLEG